MLKDKLKKHLVDSTAVAAISNPAFSLLEMAAGMSLDTSLNARLAGTTMTFLGMGSIYTLGMDLSRKLFKITDESHLNLKKVHDTVYSAAYCLAVSPAFYYISGSRDLKEIALGTLASAGIALATGGIVGYAIDAFRDFATIEKSNRLPRFIEKQSSSMKKGFIAIGIAASLTASNLIYNASEYLRSRNDSHVYCIEKNSFNEKFNR